MGTGQILSCFQKGFFLRCPLSLQEWTEKQLNLKNVVSDQKKKWYRNLNH